MDEDWKLTHSAELVDEYERHGDRVVPHLHRAIALLLGDDDRSVIRNWLDRQLSHREYGFDIRDYNVEQLGMVLMEPDVYSAFVLVRMSDPLASPRTLRQFVAALKAPGGAFAELAVAMPPPCPVCQLSTAGDRLRAKQT